MRSHLRVSFLGVILAALLGIGSGEARGQTRFRRRWGANGSLGGWYDVCAPIELDVTYNDASRRLRRT